MDGIVTATKCVRCVRRLAALESKTYPKSSAIALMRARVAALTLPSDFNARLTVITDTPAASATSFMVRASAIRSLP